MLPLVPVAVIVLLLVKEFVVRVPDPNETLPPVVIPEGSVRLKVPVTVVGSRVTA